MGPSLPPRPPAAPPLAAPAAGLIRWIGAGGLASAPQIQHHLWITTGRPATELELRRLVADGYLQVAKLPIPFLRYRGVYLLTARSHAQLGAPAYPRLAHLPVPGYRALILAQEARLHIEQYLAGQGGQILRWEPEPAPQPGPAMGATQILLAPDAETPPRGLRLRVYDPGSAAPADLAALVAAYQAAPEPILWACLPARAPTLAPLIVDAPHIALLVLTPRPGPP